MKYQLGIVGLKKIGTLYDMKLPEEAFTLSHARGFHLHPDFELEGAVDPEGKLREDREFFRLQTTSTTNASTLIHPETSIINAKIYDVGRPFLSVLN